MPILRVALWGLAGVSFVAYVAFATLTYSGEAAKKFGIIGSGASVLGIAYTIYQIGETKRLAREAKKASDAAREASEAATTELKRSYYLYSLLDAKRLLAEARQWVVTKKWSIASVRASDMASHASQLAYARPNTDSEWIEARDRLRDWANIFATIQTNHNLDRAADDWNQLCAVLQNKIDRECSPFGITEESE